MFTGKSNQKDICLNYSKSFPLGIPDLWYVCIEATFLLIDRITSAVPFLQELYIYMYFKDFVCNNSTSTTLTCTYDEEKCQHA